MASPSAIIFVVVFALVLVTSSLAAIPVNTSAIKDTLVLDYYKTKCPNVEKIITDAMKRITAEHSGFIPGIFRLHFHDCFISGCDGSVLLKPQRYNSFASELASPSNGVTMRGFEAIDEIKAEVEKQCPGVVSCADILAYASRDAVVLAGNTPYAVPAGRRDSGFTDGNLANGLPGGGDPIDYLTDIYAVIGLTVQDMVVLQGSHSIGQIRCVASTATPDLVYNATGLHHVPNEQFRTDMMNKYCHKKDLIGTSEKYTPMNPEKNDTDWGTSFYKNLLMGKGVVPADLAMAAHPTTKGLMKEYAEMEPKLWMEKFGEAMVKIGKINVITGEQGNIRRHCSVLDTVEMPATQ